MYTSFVSAFDLDRGRASEVLDIITPLALASTSDLEQELTVGGELENVGIRRTVAADPNVVLVVDVDTVFVLRPLELVTGAAPRTEHGALGRKLDYRWGRYATHAFLTTLSGVETPRSVDDPDVISLVDCDAGHLSEDPVVWQVTSPETGSTRKRGVSSAIVAVGSG